MPKLKTHSGAKKRFKLTAKGKLKYKKAGLRHLLTGMSTKRGRRLRKSSLLNPIEAKRIRQLISR
jgi:large subunit ribosomal protein L35